MGNKKNISVRLTDSDLRSLKALSTRLYIKESDLFRFAVKSAMHRVMPLIHSDLKGIDFLVALLDCGQDILKYFEFDAHQLDKMINKSVSAEQLVSMEDIELVAIATVNESYLAKRLNELGEDLVSKDFACEALKNYLKRKYEAQNTTVAMLSELA